MKDKEIQFSILIPAYKRRYLREAVLSCTQQEYDFFEIIIVDDCSPEDLHTVIGDVSDSRIRFFRNDVNFGAVDVVNNWNKCLEYSNGDYVICMGDDDRLLPNCLDDLNQLIKKYPQLDVYHIQTRIIDENGVITRELEQRPEFENALEMLNERFKGRSQYIGDFCFNSKTLKGKKGFYYLPLAWTSDDVTVFRACLPNGIANTQTVGFEYRENLNSISENTKNDRIKIEALRLSEQWYYNAFSRLSASMQLDEVREAMSERYKKLYVKHVYGDINDNPLRFFYWLLHSKSVHVSPYILLKVMGKCLRVKL